MYEVSTSRFHLTGLQTNLIVSAISSFLFFCGWWIIADIEIQRVVWERKIYYIPGIIATFALFFTNVIPAHYFYDSSTFQQGYFSPGVAKAYLFLWLMISFGCLTGGFYILFHDFILKPENLQWPGYGICLQNGFIFASNMLLRFAKKYEQFY